MTISPACKSRKHPDREAPKHGRPCTQDAFARTQQMASSRHALQGRTRAQPPAAASRLQSPAEAGEAAGGGGGSRQTSAPVSIPGAADAGAAARHSRIHSSGDLAAMQQQHDITAQVRLGLFGDIHQGELLAHQDCMAGFLSMLCSVALSVESCPESLPGWGNTA